MSDKGSNVILLLLDLSAAFDTVNHNRLLYKLQNLYNINGTVIEWFKSYLKDRHFSVKINNSVSEICLSIIDRYNLLYGQYLSDNNILLPHCCNVQTPDQVIIFLCRN